MNTKNKNLNWFFIFLFLFLTIRFVNAYDVNITFYDESTLETIPTVTITDANTSVYTSDINGFWQTQLIGAKDLTISKTGIPSVMAIIRGISASMASIIAEVANLGGTKIKLASGLIPNITV